jgi:hypothetical protein
VAVNDYVLVQGIRDTRVTLARWQQHPWAVARAWLVRSLAIAVGLLLGVWIVASQAAPDPTHANLVGLGAPVTGSDLLAILGRNSLVLAFHATACVAGFIAGASMPISAARRQGVSRWVHEKAGKIAIVFVVGVTAFSLANQAYYLGHAGSTIAAQEQIPVGTLILTVLPQAIPELTALFLPLAAWLMASRRGEWNHLMAATFVTVLIAVPMLVASALIEAYLWPVLLQAASPVS